MRILSKYVLREFLVPLFYCMAGFIAIYVLFELFGSFSRLADAKMPLMTTVHYFCGYLAPHFKWLAPPALMLATLYTMWNFCRHSELVAMRASGVGFFSISRPMLAMSLVVAAFVAWVGEVYVPARAQWARTLRNEKFDLSKAGTGRNITYRDSESGRTWTVDSVGSDGVFRGVKVVIDRPGHATRLANVMAKEARWIDGEWWFSGLKVQHYDASGSEALSPTPELDALELRVFPQFRERPSDIMAQNRAWEFNSVRDKFRYLRRHRNLAEERRREYVYDAWAGLLAPLACFVITLLAIPAGIASGRQSVFRGVLGAIGMFFAFYAATILCMAAAQTGHIQPVLAAFLPLVLFFAAGVAMFRRLR